MKMTSLLFVSGSVLLTAGAQLALKVASSKFTQSVEGQTWLASLLSQLLHPLTIAAIVAYVGSLVLWLLALREMPLSLAFPFSGLTIALVVGAGMLVLGESITWPQASGIALVVSGVVLLAHGS